MEKPLYDSIGVDYNQTRTADSFLVERFVALMSPRKNISSLDVGCGTGNYTIALAGRGYPFYGVEPSKIMIEEARQKSDSVIWTQANAEELPFENEFFGASLASLTVHHWKNLENGFAEIYRVLDNGSNFVILTAFPEQMEKYWLCSYFPKMMKDYILSMPTRHNFESALNSAGFTITNEEKYFIQPNLQDLSLYSGKQRPDLYLNARVRKGLSAFAAFGFEEEEEIGLQNLTNDLEDGNFAKIAREYESDLGDYSFVVATKPL